MPVIKMDDFVQDSMIVFPIMILENRNGIYNIEITILKGTTIPSNLKTFTFVIFLKKIYN